jgi:hypothetical protein
MSLPRDPSPRDKYENDPEYRNLVNLLEGVIHEARFTPSELREACIFACIRYEQHRAPEVSLYENKENEETIQAIQNFINRRNKKRKQFK